MKTVIVNNENRQSEAGNNREKLYTINKLPLNINFYLSLLKTICSYLTESMVLYFNDAIANTQFALMIIVVKYSAF